MRLPRILKSILKLVGIRVASLYYFEKNYFNQKSINNLCDLSFEKLGESEKRDLLKLVVRHTSKRDIDIFKFAMSSNDVCFGLNINKKRVGYIWAGSNIIFEKRTLGRLDNAKRFIYGGLIFDQYRRKGYFKRLVNYTYNTLNIEGAKCVGCFTDAHNSAAISVQKNFTDKQKRVFLIMLPFEKTIYISKKGIHGRFII